MGDEDRLTPEEREELSRQVIREKEIARQAARDAAIAESARIRQDQAAQTQARLRAEHNAEVAESTNTTLYVLLGVIVIAMALGAFFLFGRNTQPTTSVTVEPEQAQPQATQPQQPAPTVVVPPPPVVVDREPTPPQPPTTIIVKPPPASNPSDGNTQGSGSGAGSSNDSDQSGQ